MADNEDGTVRVIPGTQTRGAMATVTVQVVPRPVMKSIELTRRELENKLGDDSQRAGGAGDGGDGSDKVVTFGEFEEPRPCILMLTTHVGPPLPLSHHLMGPSPARLPDRPTAGFFRPSEAVRMQEDRRTKQWLINEIMDVRYAFAGDAGVDTSET